MGGVKGAWAFRVAWMAAVLAAGGSALAQEEGGESSEPRLLSLQASSVWSGLEQVNVDMPLMARLPDFRLKMVQPDAMSLSPDTLEPKLRGVELQLPGRAFGRLRLGGRGRDAPGVVFHSARLLSRWPGLRRTRPASRGQPAARRSRVSCCRRLSLPRTASFLTWLKWAMNRSPAR